MTEPILTYVKGEGWVYAPDDFFCEAVTRDGKKCRIYKRDPVIGDCWCGRYDTDTEIEIQKYTSLYTLKTFKERVWIINNTKGENAEYYVFEFDQ